MLLYEPRVFNSFGIGDSCLHKALRKQMKLEQCRIVITEYGQKRQKWVCLFFLQKKDELESSSAKSHPQVQLVRLLTVQEALPQMRSSCKNTCPHQHLLSKIWCPGWFKFQSWKWNGTMVLGDMWAQIMHTKKTTAKLSMYGQTAFALPQKIYQLLWLLNITAQ